MQLRYSLRIPATLTEEDFNYCRELAALYSANGQVNEAFYQELVTSRIRSSPDNEFHEVPEDVARADAENGCWGLFLSDTEQIGSWITFKETVPDKTKSQAPLSDCYDNMLAVGDIVTYSEGTGPSIGRVTRFTKAKIVVANFDQHQHDVTKDPKFIIKIHNSLWT